MKIHRIVNSFLNSCTYIVHGETSRQAMIVDCGDVAPIVEYIENNGLELRYVLLTHSHFDHIYGLNELAEKFPTMKVCTNCYGAKALSDIRRNMSLYNESPFQYNGDNVVTLDNVTDMDFIGDSVEIIPTPGHDPSCICYKIGDCLFTGDSYIPGVRVVVNFPHSDKMEGFKNEDKLKDMEKQGLKIFAGHVV